MVNAYTRGAVEVLYAGAVEVWSWCGRGTLVVRSRYARGAVEVRSWCGQGTLVMRSRYARGAVEVRSWCGRGTLVVSAVERSRYARGTVLVRSRYAHGALLVRCLSLTFQRGDTVFVPCSSSLGMWQFMIFVECTFRQQFRKIANFIALIG